MPTANITRRPTVHGVATPISAPIYVDSDGSNILKFIPAGSGSTEVQIVDASSTQTLTNKTLTSPAATSAVLTSPTITTGITPTTNDGAALGSTSLKFSDLWLASGAVIDFNSGDVTITHSANDIAVAGGTLTTSGGVAMGAATTWSGTPTVTAIPSFIGASGGAVTAALLHGGGTTTTKCTTATADKNFIGYWTESTATSGDSRGMYLRHYFGAAGSGEALRAFGTATAANVATGGTANGAHISFSLSGAAATISGQAHAARLTLGGDAQTRTINANMGVLNLDSDFAAGNTVPATVAFLKVTDTAAVKIGTFLRLPNAANGSIFAAHTTQTLTHSIKAVTDDGTLYYIMCTNSAANRS